MGLLGPGGGPGEQDRLPILDEGAEALDVGGAEGDRLADRGRAGVGLGDLEADGQGAGQQPEADRDKGCGSLGRR